MGYSDYYEKLRKETDEELIESWEVATNDEAPPPQAAFYYTSDVWLPIRDVIHERGLDEKVKEYDIRLLKYVLKNGADNVYDRDVGNINPPLSSWWWWLDKIAEGEYPAELLPEYLRGIYQEWLKEKAFPTLV